MDISYFQKINNTYNTKSKQEVDLYLLNQHVDKHFADSIDYHVVNRNGEPFELLIIKDTDGNTFKKKIKSKHSTPFNLGDYIEWNGQFWIVTLLDTDDKTYHSGYMYLCTVPLRWQNSEGKIIVRYAYSEDFTKYTNGTTGNNTITIGDNQYGLTLPIDSETKKLKRDMRFPIDFDDAEKPDIYKLTNRKVNLNNNEYFGRGGTMLLTMSYDSFNASNDKLITLEDGTQAWICDYIDFPTTPPSEPSKPDETTDLWNMKIDCPNIEIKPTGYPKTLTATLYNTKTGETIPDIVYEWNVQSSISEYLSYTINENILKLSLSKEYSSFGDDIFITCNSKYTGQTYTIKLITKGVF